MTEEPNLQVCPRLFLAKQLITSALTASADASTSTDSSTTTVEDRDPVKDLISKLTKEDKMDVDTSSQLTEDELLGQLSFKPYRARMLIFRIGISAKAAQLILSSENPVDIMRQLTENFPKYAVELGRRIELDRKLSLEMGETMRRTAGGAPMIWFNGAILNNIADFNPFK